jgi:hypothetical protein
MFGRWARIDPEREAASARIKAWVRDALALDEQVTVSVNEIECGDPACPGGVETVVLVRAKAAVTRAMKIAGPATDVTRDAVLGAVAATRTR